MFLSWWRSLVESVNPKNKAAKARAGRRLPRKFRASLALEHLEDRFVPAPLVSIPAALLAEPNQILQIPIRVDSLQDDSATPTGQTGLHTAQLYLDPGSSAAGSGGPGALGNFTFVSVTKGPLILNSPASGLWTIGGSQAMSGTSEGEIKITASANAPANDIVTTDPTNGGLSPNGDVLLYLNVMLNATPASQGTPDDSFTFNSSKDTNAATGGLVPSFENGLTAGTIYPALDDTTNGVSSITFTTTAVAAGGFGSPATALTIPINISGTANSFVTVAINYTPLTPTGSPAGSPGGSGITSADAAILFDPTFIDDTGVNAPTVVAGNLIPTDTTENWSTTFLVDSSHTNAIDPTQDTLGLHLVAGSGSIASDTGPVSTSGSLWVITFHLKSTVPPGTTTVINLVPSVTVGSGTVTTDINQGLDTNLATVQYALAPPPANAADGTGAGADPGDGSIMTPASNPMPTLASVNPATAMVGDPTTTITLTGTGFVSNSGVSFNGTALASVTFVNSTTLMADIPSTDLTTAGFDSITVVNPTPGGGTSGSQTFTVNNPLPTLTNISPSSATLNSTATTITLTGTNFLSISTADFNGTPLATTFVSSTSLTAVIPASDLTTAGTASITVVTAAPGGGTSAGQTFTVNNPLPTLTTISPNSALLNSSATTITLTGTNFLASSTADFNGVGISTTFVSATTLTAIIPASDLSTAGNFPITVVTPVPGGGTSASQTFTVSNPLPTLASISPNSAIVGASNTTITLTGTNFIASSTADFNGVGLATTFVSATSLTAIIPAADLTTAGMTPITVVNSGPGGGTSGSVTFTVNNPLPTLTSISPNAVALNSGPTIISLTGTNFLASSTADFNGVGLATTFVNSSSLTATIPASDQTTAGTFMITVFTPTPGGGTSSSQTFTVNNPLPTLASIGPNSATVGDPNTTITLTGTNFVSTSTADFNGVGLATTFVSATSLTAVIPASDLTTAGMDSITVVNPTPGGGTSTPSITFTVMNPAPTLTSINPNAVPANSSATTITLTGTGFVSTSTADFNGTAITTTFVSATQLTAVIPAADLTTIGTDPITVVNAGPGGGTSGSVTFTVLASNPVPTLTSISPNMAIVNDPATTITLTGSNFVSTSTAQFNGTAIATTFVSGTTLTAIIPAADLTAVGTDPITVISPTPGGGTTGPVTFTINANPVPTLTSISPTSVTAGAAATTITLTGTNFDSNSSAEFNGVAIATTFVSATSLTAVIPAADLTTGGTDPVTVVNPTPGGGTSGAQTFTINNPAPTLTSISPTSATAGAGNTTITLTGTNFVSTSTADFNGVAIATTFVSATSLTAVIPAADLTTAGMDPITVVNPTPAGGTSTAQMFTVNNPVPALASISPNSAIVGAGNTTITLTGSSFVAGSTVDFNATPIATTFVSATQLTAVIPAADLTATGPNAVTVVNAGPGGGTSSAQTFNVNNPMPALTNISPNSATLNDPATTITLTGTNFVSTSTAQFNGTPIATTFVSGTSLTAIIPAADLTAVGTDPITVFSPTPGGGTSNPQAFFVNNPFPTLTSIAPTSAMAGAPATTITLTGSRFIASSKADFNGTPITTTFVSATMLTAVIPASDLTTGGANAVTVVNPGPGGGTSGSQTFIVNQAPTITNGPPTTPTTVNKPYSFTYSTTGFPKPTFSVTSGALPTGLMLSAAGVISGTPTATGMFTAMVTASNGNNPPATQTFTIDVQAPATHFLVSAPATATAGNQFMFTVTAEDMNNAKATNYVGTVTLTSSDAQASLPMPVTLMNGVGTFTAPVTLRTAGNQTITATDAANNLRGTSNAIDVSPAAAMDFVVSAPATAKSGTAFTFTVTAFDGFGNVATGYTGTIRFASSDAAALLPANSTLTNGTGTFTATLKTTGTETLSVFDTITPAIDGVSGVITVSPATGTETTLPNGLVTVGRRIVGNHNA